MLNDQWTKIDYYCWFVILLRALKLCMNAILIDIDLVVDNNCFLKTPLKYRKITKIYSLEINYFSTSYESTYNVIVDSVAQLADINIVDSQYINSWQIVWYIVVELILITNDKVTMMFISCESHCWYPILNICCNQSAND